MSERTFDDDLQQAVRQSVIKFFATSDWFRLDYGQRLTIPANDLRTVWQGVDMNRVAERVREKIEDKLADAFFNNMATEIATDVKRILCNTELREDIRAVIREKIRMAAAAISAE